MNEKTCPVCKQEVAERAENAAFPFCSSRCKQVDLGRWFNEDYRIPVSPHSGARSWLKASEEPS